MINDFDDPNRQLLPRWVPFLESHLYYPSKDLSRKMNEVELFDFKKAINDWDKFHTLPLAGEIIARAHYSEVTDIPAYQEALDFILEDENYLSDNPFLCSILNKSNDSNEHKVINNLKREVQYNYSPSLYVDLAYYYEKLGQSKKAEKAIEIACKLNPTNPYLIRYIARFFILEKKIDEALYILTKNDDLNNNPLIISAEISIAEANNYKSKLLRKGHSIIKKENISSQYENELFATFGTLEFNNGNSKKGKKLILQSLIVPNENIIAQARYLMTKFQKEINIDNVIVPNRFEADTWIAYNKKDFEKVIEQSRHWFYFQPFSASSAIMNTYINSLIFEKESESIEMAQKALKISKDDFSLQNNLVVAACRSNQIELANKEFKKLQTFTIKETIDKEVLLATCGLLDYRNGNHELGRKKYEEAILNFERVKDYEKMARCLYFFGCEIKNAKENDYDKIIARSKELAERYKYSEILAAINKNFKDIK